VTKTTTPAVRGSHPHFRRFSTDRPVQRDRQERLTSITSNVDDTRETLTTPAPAITIAGVVRATIARNDRPPNL